jgi:arginase
VKTAPRRPKNGSRREFLIGALATATVVPRAPAHIPARPMHLILAPSNLGLRPPEEGVEPGTWQAPAALKAAGVAAALRAQNIVELPRPLYQSGAQPGTRIRNGLTLRPYLLSVAAIVRAALERGAFPLVLGGDCSLLLGGLYAARLSGGRGLVHVDGHSDFYHPSGDEAGARLGAAAGMDLALATGRGEALLTQWPGIDGPLVEDSDAIQIGERNAFAPEFTQYYRGLKRTRITRLIIQEVERVGVRGAGQTVIERLQVRHLERAWLHVDLDILDQTELPAVDSPGSPGLKFAELGRLLAALHGSGRIMGANIANYDPSLDPQRRYARPIVEVLARAFG